MKFDIVTGCEKTEFEVHRHGCRDVKKLRARFMGVNVYTAEADTPEEAVKDEVEGYNDCQQDWYEEDFRIMPCCKKK